MTVRPPGAVAASAASNARTFPAASTTTSHLAPLDASSAGSRTVVAPSSRAWCALGGDPVDRDDVPAPDRDRGEQGGHAHATEPDDHDALSGLGRRGIEQGAAPGQHRAAEHRGHVRRHVVVHRDDRAGVHDGVGGEGRDPQVVVHRGRRRASSRRPPPSSSPAALLADPGPHGIRPPVAQPGHRPQRGRKVMTTRWPIARSVTPGPRAVTCPLASWPSSIGTGRARLPSTTDRSEWQTPAAAIRTSTSPGPGASSSSSPTVRGRVRRPRPRPADLLQDGAGDPHERACSAWTRTSRIAAGIGTVAREVRSMYTWTQWPSAASSTASASNRPSA